MSEDRDRLDDLLDRALSVHGRCEPRPGLEGRVLASLRARPTPPWWRTLLAGGPARFALGALAVAGIVAAFVLVEVPRTRETAAPPVAAAPEAPQPMAVVAEAPSQPVAILPEPAVAPAPPRERTRLPSVARVPRRPSFPRAAPLSEQEQLLLRYVSEAPLDEVAPRAGFLDAPAMLPPLPDPTTQP